jgi:hypothetical protein
MGFFDFLKKPPTETHRAKPANPLAPRTDLTGKTTVHPNSQLPSEYPAVDPWGVATGGISRDNAPLATPLTAESRAIPPIPPVDAGVGKIAGAPPTPYVHNVFGRPLKPAIPGRDLTQPNPAMESSRRQEVMAGAQPVDKPVFDNSAQVASAQEVLAKAPQRAEADKEALKAEREKLSQME